MKMYNRKILYGYLIRNGELTLEPEEAETVKRIFACYLAGLSYLKTANMLNEDKIPYSVEAPEWNKHKVKRLLEDARYTGEKNYPVIIGAGTFAAVQSLIQSKTAGYTAKKPGEKEAGGNNAEKLSAAPQTKYTPSVEVIKAQNALNRALDSRAEPEEITELILQGITARYLCCG